VKDVNPTTFDLSVKNPARKDLWLNEPKETLVEMGRVDRGNKKMLNKIGQIL